MITKDEILAERRMSFMATFDTMPCLAAKLNDYRNPLVASAMKTLGYVNMFNRGVGQVQIDLKENDNQPAEFNVNLITAFKVDVKVSQSYTNENGGKTSGKVGGDVPSLSPALSQVLSPVLSPVCPQLINRL